MVRRVEEKLVEYPMSIWPSMLREVKRRAAKEKVSVRLWIRKAISNRIEVQDRMAREDREAEIQRQLAEAQAVIKQAAQANEQVAAVPANPATNDQQELIA